jgi:hypothetical protein
MRLALALTAVTAHQKKIALLTLLSFMSLC